MIETGPEGSLRVEVCAVRLNAAPDLLELLWDLLNEEERQRAKLFKFAHLRDRFVQTHAALRIMASCRLGLEPRSLVVLAGPFGKPKIDRAADLEFNLSHSEGIAAFAFARGCQVGVDVERIREIRDFDAIVRQQFSAAERREFEEIEARFREQAFFNAWTRKEAYIKARGAGLSIPLDSFSVSLKPGATALTAAPAEDSQAEWHMQDLQLEPGYAGAVVYSGERRIVKVLETLDLGSLWNSGVQSD
jgi:4'-phosphopantetheinyl transferase